MTLCQITYYFYMIIAFNYVIIFYLKFNFLIDTLYIYEKACLHIDHLICIRDDVP